MVGSPRRVPKAFQQVHALAFAPLLFQAAMTARDNGVLAAVRAAGDGGIEPADVARRAGVSYYAARVLLEGCLALELVRLDGRRYRLTDAGYLWSHDEMTRVNADFVQDVCYVGAARLGDSLREGRPAGLEVFGDWSTIYEHLTELPPKAQASWFAFDHFYSDGAFPLAFPRVFEPRPRRLLDVGGNTGKWALYCAAHDPDVEVTIVDHPGQLARLRAAAEQAGVGARVHTVPLDLLDHAVPLPAGFDVVWMSQFLDCFGEDDVLRLLERGKAALAPGGRLCVMETFWDRQPNDVAALCLQGTSLYFACMANGQSRMYHSQDLLDLVAKAGLRLHADEKIGMSHTLFTCVA